MNVKADDRVQTEFQRTVTHRLFGSQEIMQHAFPQPLPADQRLSRSDILIHGMENYQPGDDNVRTAFGEPVQLFALLIRHCRERLHKTGDGLTR
ncbi:hypothetical protein D3C81_1332370 [compost metagenome]